MRLTALCNPVSLCLASHRSFYSIAAQCGLAWVEATDQSSSAELELAKCRFWLFSYTYIPNITIFNPMGLVLLDKEMTIWCGCNMISFSPSPAYSKSIQWKYIISAQSSPDTFNLSWEWNVVKNHQSISQEIELLCFIFNFKKLVVAWIDVVSHFLRRRSKDSANNCLSSQEAMQKKIKDKRGRCQYKWTWNTFQTQLRPIWQLNKHFLITVRHRRSIAGVLSRGVSF